MITWIEGLLGWDRSLPVALIATGVTPAEGRALQRALVAGAFGIDADTVLVENAEGRAPEVKQPVGSGLFLSVSRRGPFTAVALAASQVGVDVELVDLDGDIPWNVLHRSERAMLGREDGLARATAFARLWSLKEAYLKALGVGLFREPSSFAVSIVDGDSATFNDPLAPASVAAAKTVWRVYAGARAVVSAVVLGSPEQDRG